MNRLASARRELLDLSTRNRLLSTPRHQARAKIIEVIDEKADLVFDHLVTQEKVMTFLPRPTDAPDIASASDAESLEDLSVYSLDTFDDEEDDGPAARHVDNRLQTTLDDGRLRKRLLQLHYDARSALDEHGFNILYLAVGFLKWFEDDKPDKARYAPLLFVPVTLKRSSARTRFKVSYSGDEFATNLSLQEKLKTQFSIGLPDLPEVEDLVPSAYFKIVAEAVKLRPNWEVQSDDISLGMFSFSKLLMYRDLDPDKWPAGKSIAAHGLIRALLGDGFTEGLRFTEDAHIDEFFSPAKLPYVVDADSSQTLAIEEARAGQNLVIQGPPGTGKSQTISNLIAAAVADGRSVLFVSEKRAALEVVKRRLESVGLGDMCLELHSHKARKRAVLDDLAHTLSLGPPSQEADGIVAQLESRRDTLNRHAALMHRPILDSGITPYRALGILVQLGGIGVDPPDFRLDECAGWTPDEVGERERTLDAQTRLLKDMGTPDNHIWRGTGITSLLPTDVTRLVGELATIIADSDTLRESIGDLSELLNAPGTTLREASELIAAAELIGGVPDSDHTALADRVWIERTQEIRALIETGTRFRNAKDQLDNTLTERAWDFDFDPVRTTLGRHGDSVFRFFSSEYRGAVRELKSCAKSHLPTKSVARIALLDSLAGAKNARIELQDGRDLGASAFGSLWKHEDSSWTGLEALCAWVDEVQSVGLGFNLLNSQRALEEHVSCSELGRAIARQAEKLTPKIEQVFSNLKLDLDIAFEIQALDDIPLSGLAHRMGSWVAEPGRLQEWLAFRDRDQLLRKQGLAILADRATDGRSSPDELVDLFRYAHAESLIRTAWESEPALRDFDGRQHEAVVEEFQDLDATRMKLAASQVAAVHHQSIPRGGASGEIGTIRHEIEKKRRHLPLRKLLDSTGQAVQRIKPVFMMSPMSVAQYLKPGGLTFDLLVIDEASQVRPVEALGAVSRCKQMVVVGDKKQLPPTRFFQSLIDDEDVPEDELLVSDVESILALAGSAGVNSKMLRWHYRSRHESLIAVSNRSFYNDELFIVPSPEDGDHLGINFHLVADGVYDRGGTRANRREAEEVADAVIRHAQTTPHLSLGVGTFSVAQRDAILDELELWRRADSSLEVFFSEGGIEPFFVKNIETIQGDERDVILISVGYARDSSGYMAMNFGPLSSDGGERRLNVLISRAKMKMDIFTSITADDIDLARTTAFGPRVLKRFLRYAQSGYMDIPEVGVRGPDSEFEEEVARSLVNLGHQVVHQVGSSGFIIDLAVVDASKPGRYVLGIECDGATYHSSRSARDRDSLRQAVLEDRGWTIHRIWSTDWFKDPDGELRKAHDAIFKAQERASELSGPTENPRESDEPAGFPRPLEITRIEDGAKEEALFETTVYRETEYKVSSVYEPHEVPIDPMLRDAVTKIVEDEGPIHEGEIARRLATVWGKGRAGRRIREATTQALSAATHAGLVESSGHFFTISGRIVAVRDRSAVQSKTLLKAEMLPPSEIREALRQFILHHVGCSPKEAVVGATQFFGFQRVGPDLNRAFEGEVRLMLRDDILILRNSTLYLAEDQSVG
jgi:very-short-patch-repair endonuclease